MKIVVLFLAFFFLSASAGADEWTKIDSDNILFSIEYSKSSIQQISTTVKRVRTRIVSTSDKPIPVLNIYSVISVTEYYCAQPLEKLISAEFVSASGKDPAPQSIEFPVLSEIPAGSNSYKLWQVICAENLKK